MNRRDLLALAAATPTLSVGGPLPTSRAATSISVPAGFRRVRPSDPAWPTQASWEKLNQSIGGRLIKVQPLVAACRNAIDTAPCQDLLKLLRNPYYVGDQPAGTQTAGWVDAWMSAPSVYAVAAQTTADVVAAVNFARDNKLRLVVKGGGHSYQGTSDAADSLLIWTRPMNQVVLHDDFVAQGCAGKQAPQPAVTVEAGAVWMHTYDAVTTKGGRYVQGGGCATVGVAGLIQSGGFGSFSKNYGTAAGGLLEAEVVTADGQVRIANACMNPDLFWGLKGGGGGSLGVVTRLTLRTRELPAQFGAASGTIKATSDQAYRRLIEQFVGFYRDNLLNAHWGESVTFGADNTFTVSMVSQGLERQQAADAWRPLVDWIAASPGDFTVTSPFRFSVMAARNWWNAQYLKQNAHGRGFFDQRPDAPDDNVWFAEQNTELGVFIHGYQSVWLPESLLHKERQQRFAEALFAATRHWAVMLHFNKGLAGASTEDVAAARDTAMNPAVLSAFALAIIASGDPGAYADLIKPPADLATARMNAAKIGRAGDELRKVVPNAGSYVSESDYFERDWQRAFWGSNYRRLRAVKAKYDPEGLFFVHHGVGSEDWSADGFSRSR
jgi:FAD/FMN-containing dehydrogenase